MVIITHGNVGFEPRRQPDSFSCQGVGGWGPLRIGSSWLTRARRSRQSWVLYLNCRWSLFFSFRRFWVFSSGLVSRVAASAVSPAAARVAGSFYVVLDWGKGSGMRDDITQHLHCLEDDFKSEEFNCTRNCCKTRGETIMYQEYSKPTEMSWSKREERGWKKTVLFLIFFLIFFISIANGIKLNKIQNLATDE